VSLKLSSPYPIAIAGTLTMTISTDLTVDPAVQFVTGGRTVPFTIPANSTDAIFAGQGSQIRLQTGTVASTVTLTPSFVTQQGNVDLTPTTPTSLQFTVASVPPVLIGGQVTSTTGNSFTLSLSGFSTSRSLTTLNVQFKPSAGFNVPQTQFTIDLRQASAAWFQSANSQTFGGQFAVVAPFFFQSTAPSGQTIVQSVSSLTISVSNASGTSNPLQVTIQ
jgi:hypothetical protein